MNSEQLNSARLARWSQNGEARLTLEAASEWLNAIGFCPYFPLRLTGAAPSPSFLEAVVGRPAAIPSASERSRASELLARMIENSAAVPLKFGTLPGEQPDFVASAEVLPYIYALRGERNFKAGPSTAGNNKVTTLALHCWQAIKDQGPLDVPALQPVLGRDITEAAIARALQELWAGLYVFPMLSASGKPAQWELLSRGFPAQVNAGANTGHGEALSTIITLYFHAVVAATEDEIVAYLSPMASQSKLREVIRGLASMRQLDMIDIDGRAHVCLQGGLLPEMAVQLFEAQLAVSSSEPEAGSSASEDFFEKIEIEREPSTPQRDSHPGSYADSGDAQKRFTPKKFTPKKFIARSPASGEFRPKRFDRPAPGGHPRSAGTRFSRPRSAGDYPRRSSGTGVSDPERSGMRSADDRKPADRGLGERARRWEKSGGRTGADRAFPSRASGREGGFKPPRSKPWMSKGASFEKQPAKSWTRQPSSAGDAPSHRDGAEDRPPKRWEKSRSGPSARPAGRRSFAGKTAGFKPSGFKADRGKPWETKTGGSRSGPHGPRTNDPGNEKDKRPRRWEKPGPGTHERSAERPYPGKRTGPKPSGSKASGGKRRTPAGAEARVGSARSYAARSAAKPGARSSGAKPWAARSASESDTEGRPKRREKPEGRVEKKTAGKSGAKPFWAKNPRGGKGSTAASRTNRPRGKKVGNKKNGKKK